jgi:hypothetical protein
MGSPRSTQPATDSSEEARAFFQARVALFWKMLFFITLLSSGLGVLGAVARPGLHLALTVASTAVRRLLVAVRAR